MATGYEPLDTLKPVADDLWIVDGPEIRFYGMPFSTRMTVVRLPDGGLWLHSPIRLSDKVRAAVEGLGPVRHLIAPNTIHYAYVAEWKRAFPEAVSWGLASAEWRAEKRGIPLEFDRYLTGVHPVWERGFDWRIVRGSKVFREAVFHHRASRTLILTDLIENFEPRKKPLWMRPLLWLGGVAAPKGSMPRDMRLTFRKRACLREDIERMIGWNPERIIIAHGRWFERDGTAELRRAFNWLLD